MNPFLFLFYILYLTPPTSGRSLISPSTALRNAPESSHSSAPEVHKRSKRSLTAFLAAEVLFLEGLLAAQNSRKPRKMSRPGRINTIDSNRVKKQVKNNQFLPPPPPQPSRPPQLFHFRAPPPARPPVSTTTPVTPRLDPFIMLSAPDLSKNNYGEYELYQTLHSPAPSRAQPDIVTHPTPTFHAPTASFSARKPRKRTLHYGAFELYHL